MNMPRPRINKHGFYVDERGRTDIEVRMGDTAFGSIMRKTIRKNDEDPTRVIVNGELLEVRDPRGCAHVLVHELPRDLDTYGYG